MTKEEIQAKRKASAEFDAGYRETEDSEVPARILTMGLERAYQSIYEGYLALMANHHRSDFDSGVLAAYLEFLRRHEHLKPGAH